MDNPSDLPHAVEIEGNGVEVAGETVMKGGVSKATADLKAGDTSSTALSATTRMPAWRARSPSTERRAGGPAPATTA